MYNTPDHCERVGPIMVNSLAQKPTQRLSIERGPDDFEACSNIILKPFPQFHMPGCVLRNSLCIRTSHMGICLFPLLEAYSRSQKHAFK